MANVLLGAAARAVLPTILEKLGDAVSAKLQRRAVPPVIPPSAIPQVIEAAKEAVHDDPAIAVVNVKSSWWNVDNLTRLMTFIAALLALVFGRDVFTPQLQTAVIGLIVGFQPLYEWWRSRRRTSITKAASVNVLQKPAK